MNAHSTSLGMPLPCWARRLMFLVAAISSLFALPNLRASVYEVGTPGYITHVVVEAEYFYGSNYNSYSNYWTENYVLGEYDSLYIYDTYEEHGSGDTWYIEAYFYNSYSWTEPIYEDPPGGGGGGEPGWEPVDPWAEVDENGVGTLGTFELKDRADTVEQVAQAAEWVGMAVGIFVEPVDWFMTAVEIYRDPTNPWSYVGLIPGVPSGAGKLAKASLTVVPVVTTVIRNMPIGKVLKFGNAERGLDHIMRRHAHGMPSSPGHPSTYDGRFKQGWHMTQISDAIEIALTRSNGQHYINLDNEVYEVMLDDIIGKGVNRTTGAVTDTRKLRVVVDPSNNEIITAYPIPE